MTPASECTKRWRERFKAEDPEGYKEYRRLEGEKRYAKHHEAINKQKKGWRDDHPENVKGWKEKSQDKLGFSGRKDQILKQKYGLSLDEWMEMLVSQESKCLICGTDDPPVAKNGQLGWAVDHCHKYEEETGGIKIRGILCTRCNTLLGMAQDNTEVLLSAIQYLQKHK